MKELLNSKFFSFFTPYISYIDSGKLFRAPFSWLCTIFAIGNAIFPFYALYEAIDSNIFDAPAEIIFAFIFFFFILLFAAWFSVQYWLNRSVKMNELTSNDAEFVATPVFSTLLQSIGEWAGSYIAIVGFLSVLVLFVFGAEELTYILPVGDMIGGGLMMLVFIPIYGFMIIIVSRVMAEVLRALASIANNTAKK